MPESDPEISQRTLGHYEQNAASFWERTRGHDVGQNIAAMLRHIEGQVPYRILDFGCGPGRDLAALRALGHEAVGLEGCPSFVAMARGHSGCDVLQQDFQRLELPENRFDAIFANASLFHVPSGAIRRVIMALSTSLKPSGVLFSSNPLGRDEEGWAGERYSVWHSEDGWRLLMGACGFVELEHYYRPEGLPRDQQSWFASVWRKRQ